MLPGQVKRDPPTEVATRGASGDKHSGDKRGARAAAGGTKAASGGCGGTGAVADGTSSEKRGEERVPPISLVVPADDQEGSAEDSQELSREGDQSGSGEADQEKGDDDQEGSGEKNRVEPPPSPRVALNGQVELKEGEERLRQVQLFQEFANGNWSIAFGGIDRGSHITAAGLDSNGIVKVTATEDQDVLPLVAFTPSLWVGNSEQDYDDGDYNDRFGVGPMIVANPGFVDPDSGSPWLLGVGVMLAVRSASR